MRSFLFILGLVLFSGTQINAESAYSDLASPRTFPKEFDTQKTPLDVRLFFVSSSIEILSRAAFYIALTVLVSVIAKKILNQSKEKAKKKKECTAKDKQTDDNKAVISND